MTTSSSVMETAHSRKLASLRESGGLCSAPPKAPSPGLSPRAPPDGSSWESVCAYSARKAMCEASRRMDTTPGTE